MIKSVKISEFKKFRKIADDLWLVSKTEEEMKTVLKKFKVCGEKKKLEMNESKSKVMEEILRVMEEKQQ